jgi:hypothetical protein
VRAVWLAALLCASPGAHGLEAQPAPLRVVAIGDSVRVYEPTRLEGSVVSAGPLGLVLRSAAEGSVAFEPDRLGRFEVYTGFVPRGPRILEGTLIGLGAGLIPMLTLVGQCSDSCAFTGMALLGSGGALLGGLIGGTTAGPQWRRAQLPPGEDPGPVRPAGGGPEGGGETTARITLLRIPL